MRLVMGGVLFHEVCSLSGDSLFYLWPGRILFCVELLGNGDFGQ